jgi:hypothetical protein
MKDKYNITGQYIENRLRDIKRLSYGFNILAVIIIINLVLLIWYTLKIL